MRIRSRHCSIWTTGQFALIALIAVTGCAAPHQTAPREQTPAEAEFEAGAKRPPTAKTMYAMARILAAQGRDAAAQQVLQKIIAVYPQFLAAYCQLAELQMRGRRIEEAVGVLSKALRLAPRDAVLVNDLGMCQLMNGELAAALQTFTRASGLAPDEARYRANMATALGLLGRYDESLSLYQDVMTPADAHYNLAVLCEARHDAPRARAERQQTALLAKPVDPDGAEAADDLRRPPLVPPSSLSVNGSR